ncbi:MAG: tRNA pseudouridine(38-40) synthase TruA [Flavobacteriaceae bacterium]
MRSTYYYLFKIQFLGFRYSGWQIQQDHKTVEGMLVKTLKFIMPDREFKIMGAGRTDAKVSGLEAAFELFLKETPLENLSEFKKTLNSNLPADIKIINIVKVNKKFNIIKDSILKEYVYLFSSGSKNHPFSAPFIAAVQESLDIELMNTGASLFVGSHSFRAYTTKDSINRQLTRNVHSCKIIQNDFLLANFFPEKSYALIIKADGFLRYQVRMIMAALIDLGKHELTLEDIRDSLRPDTTRVFKSIAPGSGLMLRSLSFRDDL